MSTRFYLDRTLCDVLEEMRTLDKTKNYSALLSLIEEVQIMGNRMETGLTYSRDITELHNERKKLEKKNEEVKEVAEKLDKLIKKKKERLRALKERHE